MREYLQFLIFLEGAAVVAGYFNAKYMLRIDENWRFKIYSILEALNWVVFITTYFTITYISIYVQFYLVTSCCLLARITTAIGNCS